MQCGKCNEEIPAGYTFCRKCATSIYVDDEPVVNNYVNKSNISSTNVENNNYKPLDIDNKELMNKDQNDRKKATLLNFGSLAIVIFVLLMAVLIFLKILKKL